MISTQVVHFLIILLLGSLVESYAAAEDASCDGMKLKILELESHIAQLKLENLRLSEKNKKLEERENCTELIDQTNYINESLKSIQSDVKPLKDYVDEKYKSNSSQSSDNGDNRIQQLSRENESVNLTAMAAELSQMSQSFKTYLEKSQSNPQTKVEISNVKFLPTAPFRKIGNKYYYISKETLNWFAAAEKCRSLGGNLVNIESGEEFDELQAKLEALRYWTSGNDLANEGSFFSIATGRRMPFSRWRQPPDNHQNNEDCIEIYKEEGYKMNDYECGSEQHFICQASLLNVLI